MKSTRLFLSRLLPLLACALALTVFTGCDTTKLTPDQLAQFEAYQAAQRAKVETVVEQAKAVTQTVASVAAPVAAIVPAAQPVAAAMPVVNYAVDIIGGIALAGLALWQRIQAQRYRLAGESVIAAVERAPDGTKQIIAEHAREDGTGDFLHKWVKETTYASPRPPAAS